MDEQTLQVYAERTEDYANFAKGLEPDRDLKAFMAAVPEGGRVLDFGCGPGNSAAIMKAAGLVAEASDASPEMVAMAQDKYGIEARCETFDDLTAEAVYDGIWANFSLLHARKKDLPRHLGQIAKALKPSGIFHLGTKTGEGERRDAIGRFYAYYTLEEMTAHLTETGFTQLSHREGSTEGLDGTLAPFMIILSRKNA